MAFISSGQISALALELLARTLVLPMTVARVPAGEYRGPNGGTITVRVRLPRAARTQSTPGTAITFDAQNEIGVPVTVAHLYDGVNLTDEDLTLNLADFGDQVLEPQVQAIATGAEDEVAAAINGLAAAASFATTATVDDSRDRVLEARSELTKADVPLGGRFFACSPDIAERMLRIPEFVKADERGDGGNALRDAVIGRVYGFTFVETNALTAGEACAYHRSGFVMGTATPVSPGGAADSASLNTNGIGMRHIRQYNPNTLSEQSVVSTFAGAAAVAEDDPPTVFSRQWKLNTT